MRAHHRARGVGAPVGRRVVRPDQQERQRGGHRPGDSRRAGAEERQRQQDAGNEDRRPRAEEKEIGRRPQDEPVETVAPGADATGAASGAGGAAGAPAPASVRPGDSARAVPMIRGEGMATFYLRGTPRKLESDPFVDRHLGHAPTFHSIPCGWDNRRAMRRGNQGRARSRGAAVIEFALTLPLLVPLMLFMIEYGHYYWVTLNAVEAAKLGLASAVVQQQHDARGELQLTRQR